MHARTKPRIVNTSVTQFGQRSYIEGLETDHVRHSVARLMRGSDSHTSKLVKRGGNLLRYREDFTYKYLKVSRSISSKVLIKKLVDVCRCHLH